MADLPRRFSWAGPKNSTHGACSHSFGENSVTESRRLDSQEAGADTEVQGYAEVTGKQYL